MREVDESGQQGGDGRDEAGEVDLGDERDVVHHARARVPEAGAEVRPEKEAEQRESGIGDAVAGDTREATEDEGEHEHAYDRLDDRPADPEQRLLVAGLDVAESEEHDQLAVRPQLAQPQRPAAARRAVLRPSVCRLDGQLPLTVAPPLDFEHPEDRRRPQRELP